MRILREWIHRLRGTLRAGRRDGDLEEELRLHLEMAAEDARRGGLDAADSARAARLKAGGASQAMDALRDQRGLPWLDDLTRDVRHGLRTLRRSPGLHRRRAADTGAGHRRQHRDLLDRQRRDPAAARLSQARAVDAPDRALPGGRLHGRQALDPGVRGVPRDEPIVCATSAHSRPAEASTGGGSGRWAGAVNLTRRRSAAARAFGAGGRAPARRARRAAGAGTVLRARARPTRWPPARASEARRSRSSRTSCGSRPSADNRSSERTVHVDGRPHDIIGIMPPGVDVMDNRPEIWLPIGVHPVIRQIRKSHVLKVIGRLKDGVTPQAAQTELNRVPRELGRARRRARATCRRSIRRARRTTRSSCSRCRTRFSATPAARSGCCRPRSGSSC